jgi:ActR/RegA family two-component response regulator
MQKKRVLLVDDEPGVRATLSEILKLQEFDVTTAATVSEALEAMNGAKFDALISDLNIGEPGDGFTLVSAMRRTQPGAITIIITGYPAFDTALEAIRSQVDGYLIKPTRVPELLDLLRNKLESNQGRHSPVVHKRLSQLLSEHAEEALQEWTNTMRSLPEWQALSGEGFQDHLLGLIRELSWRIENPKLPIRTESIQAATQHGQLRKSQGFRIPDVLQETMILRQVILSLIHMHLLSLNLSSLFMDISIVSATLDELLASSVRAFLAE